MLRFLPRKEIRSIDEDAPNPIESSFTSRILNSLLYRKGLFAMLNQMLLILVFLCLGSFIFLNRDFLSWYMYSDTDDPSFYGNRMLYSIDVSKAAVKYGNGRCHYTKVGSSLATDSLGYTCRIEDIQNFKDDCCDSKNKTQYSCSSCGENKCCEIYEYCVSCCLSPENFNIRNELLSQKRFLRLFSGVTSHNMVDAYSICAMACRSNSKSVIHENAYLSAQHHCYGTESPQYDQAYHRGIFDFVKPR